MLERTAREAKRVPESTTRAPGSTNESRLDLREPRRSSSEPESESSPRERRMLERERSTESSESRPLIWLSSSMSAEESSSRENLLGGRAPGGEWLGGGGLSSSISTEIWEASRLILRFLGLRPKTMVERAANGDGPHGSVSELAAEPALANQHTVRCFYFYPAALFSQAFACSAGARCWLDVCEREREGNRPHSPTELFIIRPDIPARCGASMAGSRGRLENMLDEIDELEAHLSLLETCLPPPRPRLHTISSAASSCLPLFYHAPDSTLLSFTTQELQETFFRYPTGGGDEDRATPDEEAVSTEHSQLAFADRAWSALKMKQLQHLLVPQHQAPEQRIQPTRPAPGVLRFTLAS